MLICVLLSLFAGRLVQLQGLDASTYVAVAGHDRLRPTTLPAQRGVILDRDGEPLARSSDAYHLTTDQKLVTNPAAYALQLDGLLAADARTIQRTLTGSKRFQYVAKELTPQTWRAIEELGLQGIYAEPASHRDYPAGTVAGNVIGFVGAEGQGLAGVELSMDSPLPARTGKWPASSVRAAIASRSAKAPGVPPSKATVSGSPSTATSSGTPNRRSPSRSPRRERPPACRGHGYPDLRDRRYGDGADGRPERAGRR